MSLYIVTGAAGNLGKALVKKLTDEKQRVIAVVSPRTRGVFKRQPLVEVLPADATDEQQVEKLVQTVARQHGAINGLIACIGGFAAGTLHNTDLASLQEMIRLNFFTAYSFVRPALDFMQKQEAGGRVVFIGSRPALRPSESKHAMAYTLSKSMLFCLAECLNACTPETRVTASVLVPGTIDTATNRKNMPRADFTKWVKPRELADMAWMLVSGRYPSLREPVIKMYGNS